MAVTQLSADEAAAKIAALEAERAALVAALEAEQSARAVERSAHAAERSAHAVLQADHERLRAAYEQARVELALIKHRMTIAKAERIDTTQLELEFRATLARLDVLSGQLDRRAAAAAAAASAQGDDDGKKKRKKSSRPPTGRRDLTQLALPEEVIEVPDPLLEGVYPRAGTEDHVELAFRRGGHVRLILRRVKYQTPEMTCTAPLPPSLIPRSIAGPSTWAHIVCAKMLEGLPFYRLEDRFRRQDMPLDRGSMCRWAEELGGVCGVTVVEAMECEAVATAFVIATDATGVLVQPMPENDQRRQPCHRGTYFVRIADADHVFFNYFPREDSDAVKKMFGGFRGFVLADGRSVYDFLYRPPDRSLPPSPDDEPPPEPCTEVGCWSHARRHFWEAAIATKDARAREGLARISHMFALDRTFKKLSAVERGQLRLDQLAPLVDDFARWVDAQWPAVAGQRGLVRSAFGYARNQAGALRAFLADGRLPMTNNQSERELRRIATGRKAWLFAGSNDHAVSTGHLLTLVASARLHGLDPEAYLAELFRVLPQWPRGRFLELAPKYWRATRARLDPAELEQLAGFVTIPPAL